MNHVTSLLLSLLLLSFKLFSSAKALEHAEYLVRSMPGFDGDHFPSKHYAGYFTINKASGKRLFYYFVTSEASSVQDPLVLWVNGKFPQPFFQKLCCRLRVCKICSFC